MKMISQNPLHLATAILATVVTVPFLIQPASAQTATNAQNAQVQTGTTASGNEALYATGKPLTQSKEGFWGHLNPMARKKWVHREVDPIKDRLNELDGISATNARNIKDLDARTQAGISKADQEAEVADQHATAAGNTANQAQQTAENANTQTTNIGTAVRNLDQYQTVSQVEIHFRRGHSVLGGNSKDALDQLVSQLQGQRGYLIDVQGYSTLRGPAGITASHRMASAVTRYLVTQHQVPLYRIHEIGLGNAPLMVSDASARRHHGSMVEVTLMHNSLSALSASNSGASTIGGTQSGTPQSSSTGIASPPTTNQ